MKSFAPRALRAMLLLAGLLACGRTESPRGASSLSAAMGATGFAAGATGSAAASAATATASSADATSSATAATASGTDATSSATGVTASATEVIAAEATGGDAHPAHRAFESRTGPEAQIAACSTCHASHFLYGIDQTIVLSGGTSTAGGVMRVGSTTTTCTVACHSPFVAAGALRQPVTWNAGPLPCTSCHAEVNRPAAVAALGGSTHAPIFGDARTATPEPTTCWSCHDAAAQSGGHLGGVPALVDAGAMNGACIACHSGAGQVLRRAGTTYEERTPPLLVGWASATTGDFHGARAGTGYGGTLRAPYARGQGPLACTACHSGHASPSAFLFASTVNGQSLAGSRIDRAGVGAEALCGACHEGERHAGCVACHGEDPRPAGTPCFYCHGHEGIRHFPPPYITSGRHGGAPGNRDCSHCHSSWFPPLDAQPPAISALKVSRLGQTTATISWSTNEPATTYLEYGVGQAGLVAGTDAETTAHTIALTGLAPATTYVWRVRSTDGFRNVTETPLATFTTTAVGALTPPELVPVVVAGATVGTYTVVVNLRWYASTATAGYALQYRVVIATTPDFSSAEFVTPTDSGWIDGTPGTLGGRATRSFPVTITNLPQDDCTPEGNARTYYWRVEARDPVLGIESPWSTTDVFGAMAGDPYCG